MAAPPLTGNKRPAPVGEMYFPFQGIFLFPYLLVLHKENTSSIYLFHTSGFLQLGLIISLSIFAMKILAKATAIFDALFPPFRTVNSKFQTF